MTGAQMEIDAPDIRTPFVLFDLSRLLRTRGRRFPTGVDRIDLAIGLHLLARFGERCQFVHAAPGGAALAAHALGTALLEALRDRWRGGDAVGPSALRIGGAILAGQARMALGGRWGAPPEQTTYVNASHSGLLQRRGALARIDPRREMPRWVYIHDLIPLDYPEYQRPETAPRFARFLDAAAAGPVRFAANSADTARRLAAYAAAQGWESAPPQILTPRLVRGAGGPGDGIASPPLRPAVRALLAEPAPYFLSIGTIEPRKNHLLLLHLWRDLARESRAPRLVIVGRRGWENEMVLDILDRCAAIAPHVQEFGDLTDAEVHALLGRARALLMPSFAEGLGLPLMEAALFGVPAIASDLAALREIAGPDTVFLDPLDGPAWKREVLARIEPPAA